MRKSLFIIAVLALALANTAVCQDEGGFKYDSKSKRDPFIPLVGAAANTRDGLEFIETVDDVKLEGIIWAPRSGSVAILNGIEMSEGDRVGPVYVYEIDKNKVLLTIHDIEYVLILEEIK
jgi:hypothetical protein